MTWWMRHANPGERPGRGGASVFGPSTEGDHNDSGDSRPAPPLLPRASQPRSDHTEAARLPRRPRRPDWSAGAWLACPAPTPRGTIGVHRATRPAASPRKLSGSGRFEPRGGPALAPEASGVFAPGTISLWKIISVLIPCLKDHEPLHQAAKIACHVRELNLASDWRWPWLRSCGVLSASIEELRGRDR
jgi:hypothetical protein